MYHVYYMNKVECIYIFYEKINKSLGALFKKMHLLFICITKHFHNEFVSTIKKLLKLILVYIHMLKAKIKGKLLK